jgi:hypothetical protein
MADITRDYEVGYKKPPRSTQFQKGRSGNPRGRPRPARPGQLDVAAVLSEPLPVKIGGAARTMESYEVWLRALGRRAIKEGHLGAALEFLKICERYDLISQPLAPVSGGVLIVPRDVLEELSRALHEDSRAAQDQGGHHEQR